MATIGQDLFTEATTIALNLHTADVGAAWTLEAAQFQIITGTNRVRHNTTSLQRARKGDDIGADQMDVTASVGVDNSSTSRAAGVCARMSTDGFASQYEAYVQYKNATTWDVFLFKQVAGVRTQLATTTIAKTAGAGAVVTLRLAIRSGSQVVNVDGTDVLTTTEANSTLSGRQYAGLIMNGATAANTRLDDFLSESVAGSTPIAASDTVNVRLTESAAISILTSSTAIAAPDTIAVKLSETAVANIIQLQKAGPDTVGVALGESAAVSVLTSNTLITAPDTIAVVLTPERSIRGFATGETIVVRATGETVTLVQNTPVVSPPTQAALVWRVTSGRPDLLPHMAGRDLEL